MKTQYRRRPLVAATAVFLMALSTPVVAENSWTGAIDNDWFNPGNWSDGVVPDGTESVHINSDTPGAKIDGAATVLADEVRVGQGVGSNGQLDIANGGSLTNTFGYLGALAGSYGAANVTGAGSSWTNNNNVAIGFSGMGVLTVERGGRVSNSEGNIAYFSGSVGEVRVLGSDSAWTNSGALNVGLGGSGMLIIKDGGMVGNTDGSIGVSDGSIGAVSVVGGDSVWANNGLLYIGESGDGSLSIEDGATVSSSEGHIGFNRGAVGRVTITGLGSTWRAGELDVGREGHGVLTVAAGGEVITGRTEIGDLTGTGTVTVTGANSSIGTDRLSVRNGRLTIMDGGIVSTSVDSTIATRGGSAAVTVSGNGSTWNSGDLYIAFGEGAGSLSIQDLGVVNSNLVYISPLGIAEVDGTGSSWTIDQELLLGAGTLFIRNGAAVSSRGGDISGVVTVKGSGSKWTNSADVYVRAADYRGTGVLNIADGGSVSNVNGLIGEFPTSVGTAQITGPGSTWTNSGYLTIAHSGSGSLTINTGGVVSVANSSGTVKIAELAGSIGTLTIGADALESANAPGELQAGAIVFGAGNGTINFKHTASDYVFAPTVSGSGRINVLSGKTALTGDSSGFTGRTDVRGGTLAANGLLNGSIKVAEAGTLTGSGEVGSVYVEGALAGRQGQTLTADSLSLTAGATVEAALGTASDTALFNVHGALTLDGTLNVTDLGGFGAGVYRLFDYGGALTDNGLEIGSTPAGVPATSLSVQTVVDQQVNLVSMAGQTLSFWDGGDASLHDNGAIDGGYGVWQARDSHNWTLADGTTNGDAQPQPIFAIFQGAPGTVTVDVAAGAVQATGMQFATDGYSIAGHPLTLSGAENVIRVGDGSAAGSGYTAMIASSLTGTGALVKTDLGTLVLSGDNTYAGGTRIDAGVLEVSADGNLGDASGALTLNGGTLRAAAGFNSARQVTLIGTGTFDVSDDPLVLSGDIGGTGTLIKDGARGLILTGDNTYTGGTVIRNGSLQIGSGGVNGSIVGDILNNGSLDFSRDDGWVYGGKISGSGDVGVGNSMLLVMTGDNTYTGGTLLFGGSLQLGNGGATGSIVGEVASDSGTLIINRSDNYDFKGTLTDDLQIRQVGTGTTVLSGTHTYTGTTAVDAGTLRVNGSIATSSLTTVKAGATLGGNGTVGNTTVQGTLAPGNSIGTLTVQGNLTQSSGSTYEAELGAGNSSDQVHVIGRATVENGATLRLLGQAHAGAQYTVLTADGGLSGTYRLEDGGALSRFLSMKAAYDATHAYVNIEQTRDFASAARTRNQRATANGLDRLPEANGLHTVIANMATDEAANQAFDQLSGEAYAGVRGALLEESRDLRDAIGERTQPGGGSFWVRGLGAWGHARGDGNAARVESDRSGLLLGADWAIGDTGYVGAAAGYGKSSFDVAERDSDTDANSLHVGMYGGLDNGRFGLQAGLGYSQHDLDTRRKVAFPGSKDQLNASHKARTTQAFVRGEVALTEVVGGYLEAARVEVRSDGFQERGGQAVLRVDDGDTEASYATLGLKLNLPASDNGLQLRGSFGWRHRFGGDDAASSTHHFSNGGAFTVYAPQLERGSLVGEVGLAWALGKTSQLTLDYAGSAGGGAADSSIQARYAVQF